jgi:hypothetical protein
MKYKSFNKFITEKSAQSSAREFETFSNRASRSMARKHQECGQLSGDAKTACYYKQKDESYIIEQIKELSPLKEKVASEKAAAEKAAAEKAAAEKAAAEKPKPEMSTLADRPPATTATPNTGGSSTSTAPATTTAAAAATKFVPQEVPANATPEERQRIATANLEGSQKARNQRDFGTETPTETQIQKRSESSKSKTDARRANIASVMSDPNSPAMKAAQAEIDRIANRNKSSSTYRGNLGGAQEGINDATAERIRRRYARQANSGSGGGNGRTTSNSGVPLDPDGQTKITPDDFTAKPVFGNAVALALTKGANDVFNDPGVVGGIANGLADAGDFIAPPGSWLSRGWGSIMGGLMGVDSRALGNVDKIDPKDVRRHSGPKINPDAGPKVQASTITKDQVDASGDLRRALGIKGVGQNVDAPEAIDKARNDVGAGSAAIKPGETASTARGRIMDEMGKQGKSSDEIKNELKRLGLLSASFGAGTTVSNQKPGPTIPFQQ